MSQAEAAPCKSQGMPVIAKATSVPAFTETNLFGAGFGKDGTFDGNPDLDQRTRAATSWTRS